MAANTHGKASPANTATFTPAQLLDLGKVFSHAMAPVLTRLAALESAQAAAATPAPVVNSPAPTAKAAAKPKAGKKTAKAAKPKLGKTARNAQRAAVNAPSGSRYTCSCKGWGATEAFAAKHAGKGHVVTNLFATK